MPEATPTPATAPAAAETPAAEAAPTPEPSAPVDFQARAAALLKDAPETPAAKPAEAAKPALEPATPAAPPEAFAAKFAQVAEASKRLRAEQEAHKAQVREREADLNSRAAKLLKLEAAKEAADPIAALQELGFSYEQATDQMLGKYTPKGKPEAPKVDPEVAAVRAELAALKAERAADKEKAAIADFRSGLVSTAEKAGEKYQLVAATNSYDEALNLVVNYAKQHGELPAETPEASMELALEHVEKRLEATYYNPAVLTATKVRSRLAPVVEAPKQAADRPQATSAKSPPSALTNSLAAAAPSRAAKPEPRTSQEFIAAAAAVLTDDAG